MKHRYSIRVIAYILLFNHTLMSCFNPSVGPNPKKQLNIQPQSKPQETVTYLQPESDTMPADDITIRPFTTRPLPPNKLYDQATEQAHQPSNQNFSTEFRDANPVASISPSNQSPSLFVQKHASHEPSTSIQPPFAYKPAINKATSLASNQALQRRQKAVQSTCVVDEEAQVNLSSITVTARGGHTVTLKQQENGWVASVCENLSHVFTEDLPVLGDTQLLQCKHESSWYPYHIEVIFPRQDTPTGKGYVYVTEGWLMGGGNQPSIEVPNWPQRSTYLPIITGIATRSHIVTWPSDSDIRKVEVYQNGRSWFAKVYYTTYVNGTGALKQANVHVHSNRRTLSQKELECCEICPYYRYNTSNGRITDMDVVEAYLSDDALEELQQEEEEERLREEAAREKERIRKWEAEQRRLRLEEEARRQRWEAEERMRRAAEQRIREEQERQRREREQREREQRVREEQEQQRREREEREREEAARIQREEQDRQRREREEAARRQREEEARQQREEAERIRRQRAAEARQRLADIYKKRREALARKRAQQKNIKKPSRSPRKPGRPRRPKKGFWASLWGGIKRTARGVWNACKTGYRAVKRGLTKAVKAVGKGFTKGFNAIRNWFKAAGRALWNGFRSGVSAFAGWISKAAKNAWLGGKRVFGKIWSATKWFAGRIGQGIGWLTQKIGRASSWLFRKMGKGLSWIGKSIWRVTKPGLQKLWGGIKWLGKYTWAGLKAVGKWCWEHRKGIAIVLAIVGVAVGAYYLAPFIKDIFIAAGGWEGISKGLGVLGLGWLKGNFEQIVNWSRGKGWLNNQQLREKEAREQAEEEARKRAEEEASKKAEEETQSKEADKKQPETQKTAEEEQIPLKKQEEGSKDETQEDNEEDELLVNPTGKSIRNDSGGLGHFGAPRGYRNGEQRLHEGIDFSADIGQNIFSPLDGRATNRVGPKTRVPLVDIYPLKVRPEFDYIQILYVNKPEGIQNNVVRLVKAGEPIGTAANLQDLKYPPNVGPHVHLQMYKGNCKINPTPFFFKKQQ